jgi:hypothetical protein
VEAAGGLEVHRGADQLVDELERFDVLDDSVYPQLPITGFISSRALSEGDRVRGR